MPDTLLQQTDTMISNKRPHSEIKSSVTDIISSHNRIAHLNLSNKKARLNESK